MPGNVKPAQKALKRKVLAGNPLLLWLKRSCCQNAFQIFVYTHTLALLPALCDRQTLRRTPGWSTKTEHSALGESSVPTAAHLQVSGNTAERIETWKTGRKAMKCCLLDTVCLWNSWTHGSCGYLRKIKHIKFQHG